MYSEPLRLHHEISENLKDILPGSHKKTAQRHKETEETDTTHANHNLYHATTAESSERAVRAILHEATIRAIKQA